MLILLDNPKKGDKLTFKKDYQFDKGEYTETMKIVAVWDGKIILENGETLHYFPKY